MGNSKSRLRKDLLFLYATDRVPVRTAVVVHVDIAAAEEEGVGVVAVRTGRPVVAEVASSVGIAVGVAGTGSREKHLRYSCCI